MKMEILAPEQFQGSVVGDVATRRGMIETTGTREDGTTQIQCTVPLAETFGYATDLRSMTQGQGTSTMELAAYKKVPASIQEDIIEERKQGQLVGAK